MLRVLENRLLRRISGPERDEVTREWRKLHNEEINARLLTQYCSGDKIQKRWVVHVARMGGRRCVYRVQVVKPQGKRPLGRPRHRWEDNIKALQEVGCECMDWIQLAQDRDRWLALVNRRGVRSKRGLGPTMTARGQSIGISIGKLPQTLIMSRLDQLSRLGARIQFFHYSCNFFLFVDNGFFNRNKNMTTDNAFGLIN